MTEERSTKFENSLERLETLVQEMENGDLSLNEMMAHFEEGSKLVKFCTRQLDQVEHRIEQLIEKDNGTLEAQPFETEKED